VLRFFFSFSPSPYLPASVNFVSLTFPSFSGAGGETIITLSFSHSSCSVTPSPWEFLSPLPPFSRTLFGGRTRISPFVSLPPYRLWGGLFFFSFFLPGSLTRTSAVPPFHFLLKFVRKHTQRFFFLDVDVSFSFPDSVKFLCLITRRTRPPVFFFFFSFRRITGMSPARPAAPSPSPRSNLTRPLRNSRTLFTLLFPDQRCGGTMPLFFPPRPRPFLVPG